MIKFLKYITKVLYKLFRWVFMENKNTNGINVFDAVLLKTIEYNNGQGLVKVEPNTRIKVDRKNEIALIGNDHVDIFRHEYVLIC